MLFLLDFDHRSVLEAPLHNICLFVRALDELALGDGRPAGYTIRRMFTDFGIETYNLLKSCSLIKCQTCESGALMTADSTTEVDVGIAVEAILRALLCFVVLCGVQK
jgi:hypothetical protein